MNEDKYSVLGIHGEDVETVNKVVEVTVKNDQGNDVIQQQVEARNVARVRMFVDGKMIDEDFKLPRLITVEEQIDTAVKARIEEIKAFGTDPSKSKIIEAQPEQIVVDEKDVNVKVEAAL